MKVSIETEVDEAEGVKRRGVHWYEEGDGNDYDIALQMALLGEVRYG